MAKKKQPKKVSKTVKKIEKSKGVVKISKKNSISVLRKILPIFLVLIVMFIAFNVRSGPINLGSMEERVEMNIYNNIRNIISQNINNQYPNLNEFDKQELIQEEYQKVVDSKSFYGQNIDKLVKENVDVAKNSFRASNNQTYLNAIDPYHFMKYTDLYNKNGYVGTELIDSKPFLNYKLAPVGVNGPSSPEFHTVVQNLFYYFYGVEHNSSDGEKIRAIFLIPVIFVLLSVIPIFIILNKYTNNVSAFFGSLMLATVGTYVSRTIAGFVDTDAYNVFFPLLITVFLILSLFENKIWLKLTYASLAGFAQGMFLWAWDPGWFMFLFAIISIFGYIGYLFIVGLIETKKIKKDFLFSFLELTSFITSSFIFTYIFANKNIFNKSLEGVLGAITGIASISANNIWPNVLSSVAELNPASFNQIISSVGGKFIFLLAMLGLVFLTLDFTKKYDWSKIANRLLVLGSLAWFLIFMNASFLIELTANYKLLFIVLLFTPIGVGIILSLVNQNTSNRVFLVMLLSIWIAGTIYMSLNGVRFILLLAPAFAIAFGIGLFYISKIINNFVTQEFKPKTFISKQAFGFVIISIMFGVIFAPMFTQAVAISENTLPNFDDAWYSSMYKIKNESQEDAIITSWWDFGHFFAAIADRGVTFDGGSQTTPASHWVGKLLMENDEEVSYDILRMLVCGNNEAFDKFYSYVGQDSSDAVKINKVLYSTFGAENKREIIQNNKYYNLTDEQINGVMNYLACENPRENFLITSEDMVGKAGVWAHWGSWDFTRKYVHDNYKSLSAEQIAQNIDENVTLIENYVKELESIDVRALSENIKREDLINRWFADYPSYVPIQGRYEFQCMNNQNISIICENSIEIDASSGEILNHNFGDQFTFRNLYLPGFNNTLNIAPQNSQGEFDAVLIPSGNGLNILIAQAPLGGSLFTKLFYLNGAGTEKFEKFDEVNSATGINVKVWKTKWS